MSFPKTRTYWYWRTYERLALFEKFAETYGKDAAPGLSDQAATRFRLNDMHDLADIVANLRA